MSATLMVSLDDTTLAKLDEAAQTRQMSREALLQEAIAIFLEENTLLTKPLEPW